MCESHGGELKERRRILAAGGRLRGPLEEALLDVARRQRMNEPRSNGSTKVLLARTLGQGMLPWSVNSRGEWMSIGAEVLSLRRQQGSSVEALIGAMDWQRAAAKDTKDPRYVARGHAVLEAVDNVLLKVAVHAAEAQKLWEQSDRGTLARRAARPRPRISRWMRDAMASRQMTFALFH
jgi:hypothetical protein